MQRYCGCCAYAARLSAQQKCVVVWCLFIIRAQSWVYDEVVAARTLKARDKRTQKQINTREGKQEKDDSTQSTSTIREEITLSTVVRFQVLR